MTALAKARASSFRTISFDRRPLAANAVVFKNSIAVCRAGYYQVATGAPDEVVVGRFTESVSNSGGAAGAKSANIDFNRERKVVLYENDTGAPLTVAMREQPCSALDDQTFTTFSTAKGAAAVLYDVTSEGVWIEFMFPASADDAGIPRIQSGRTTLVAGTKTVTGVTLTATSRIFVQTADPGAGAITGFAGYSTPDASRNVGAGSFVINAIDASKAVIATAVPTVDYLIIG